MFRQIDEPRWDDRDLYIIGGGKSLEGRDLSRLRERGRVLGINRAADYAPCDATFSLDHMFIRKRAESLQEWAEAGQEVFMAVPQDWFTHQQPIPVVTYLERVQGTGVGSDPRRIINGLNSGYGGLCLAVLKRARRIYMLGYDMKGENDHWHDGYEWGSGRTKIYFERWAKRFNEIRDDLPPGVEVYNCNPASGITAFPFLSYEAIGL